ncbi:MAG: thermonuclease family protein [Actinomycetes bacterium]
MRRISGSAALLAASALVALVLIAPISAVRRAFGGAQIGTVVRTIDGDTIDVRLGSRVQRVRLIGVDTPETKAPGRPVGCFGPEAAAFTAVVLTGARVRLEDDVERTDRYGRRLAYVHVDGLRFNDVLLARGYARLLVIPPNGTHARELLAREMAARRAGRGLWGACPGAR